MAVRPRFHAHNHRTPCVAAPPKKLDYEKGKRQSAASNSDYRERFQDEGDNFDRGGKKEPRLFTIKGNTMTVSLLPAFSEDKASLLRTLERNTRFSIAGEVGTFSKLRKIPSIADEVIQRFEITRRSILRADMIVGTAKHPTKNRDFRVVEFRCCLQPVEPFQNPIFKSCLAFRAIFPPARQSE